jgi:hypothetical protein
MGTVFPEGDIVLVIGTSLFALILIVYAPPVTPGGMATSIVVQLVSNTTIINKKTFFISLP